MKLITIKKYFVFLAFFAGMGLVAQSLWADVAPETPADPAQDTAEAVSKQAPADTQALGQFPQPETQPLAPATPIPGMGQEATASQQNINFPKVQTSHDEEMARRFSWWPSDARPAPYKDPERSGFWWWPQVPGQVRPWGNQGYIYVRKVIFDYKSTEGEMKPSLVIKRILKNVKVYFDYDKSELRDDAIDALSKALFTLEKNPSADILITGNADIRGSEQYNQKLGQRRGEVVKQYLLDRGLPENRIRILSRGKLDAIAPTSDLEGMQKDRNAQFMVAEVEEIMIPASQASLFEDKKVVEEEQTFEGEVRVDTRDYVIQKGDTLWDIAEKEYGDGKQWKRIYEFNKDVISNPDRPKKGTKIKIPIE